MCICFSDHTAWWQQVETTYNVDDKAFKAYDDSPKDGRALG